jgi:hypothetical protein
MDTVMERIIPLIAAWWEPVITIFYFLGVVLVVASVVQLPNPQNKYKLSKVILTGIAGILLLNLPELMDSLSYTIFNTGSEHTLSYSPPSHPGSVYVKFAIYAVKFIGLLGIGRGCWLLRDNANGQAQVMRGAVHFVGGILAVNIVQFINLLGESIGGDTQSTITAIIGN